MENTEEILDLVNENDEVIGQLPRSKIYNEEIHNFRVVYGMIRHPETGKFWIPRRSFAKILLPGVIEQSVSGHVSASENYEQGLARETAEEVNLDIYQHQFKLLGHLTPHQHGSYAFAAAYEITYDQTPDYNPDDFCDYWWLSRDEVLQQIENGEPHKSDLPLILKHFYQD